MSEIEFQKYGRNRLAEGKLPICAEMCSTKALLAGDGDQVSTSSVSVLWHVVSAQALGAGALPTASRVADHSIISGKGACAPFLSIA